MTPTGIRPSLSSCQAPRTGRFFFSLAMGILLFAAIGGTLAFIIIPGITPPKLLIRVIASPSSTVAEPPAAVASEMPRQTRPRPTPPIQRTHIPIASMPTMPVLTTPSATETTQLLAQTEAALEAFEQFQEQEVLRLQELLEKEEQERKEAAEAALLAQEKAAQEKAEQQRKEEVRRLTNREAEQRKSSERALAAQQNHARKSLAQEAAKKRATAAQASRVASTPTITKRTPPSYPSSARRKGAQGTTRIAATVTSGGKVSSPHVVSSSGHRALDSCALAAVKKWCFAPAKNELGQPIAYQMTIPVTFRLN